MKRLLQRLWTDESGVLISIELILLATVVVIGILVGLAALRDAMVNELADVSDSINNLDQSFSLQGRTGHSASTAGSVNVDVNEFDDRNNNRPAGIVTNTPTTAPAIAAVAVDGPD